MIREFRKLWKEETYRKVVVLFLLMKVVILVAGILGQLIPIELTHRQMRSDNIFLNPWLQSDSGAYLDIAKNGYNEDFNNGMGNYAWYPLYPVLIKLLGFLGYDFATFLIANVFSFLAITMLYLLVKKELNGKMAYRTAFYILLFPTAYFFTAAYTESLFLFLSLFCFWSAKGGKYLASGIAGFFASLTRMQGILLFFPVLYIYLREKKFNIKKIKPDCLSIFLIPMGLLILMAYHQMFTGNALILFHAQEGFSRQLSFPWTPFINEFIAGITSKTLSGSVYYFFNLFIITFFTALTILSFKHLSREYGIYLAVSLLLPLSTSLLFGIVRFVLVLFPAFMVMAKLSENKNFGLSLNLLYFIFIVLLILFTVRHVNEDIYIGMFNMNPK